MVPPLSGPGEDKRSLAHPRLDLGPQVESPTWLGPLFSLCSWLTAQVGTSPDPWQLLSGCHPHCHRPPSSLTFSTAPFPMRVCVNRFPVPAGDDPATLLLKTSTVLQIYGEVKQKPGLHPPDLVCPSQQGLYHAWVRGSIAL